MSLGNFQNYHFQGSAQNINSNNNIGYSYYQNNNVMNQNYMVNSVQNQNNYNINQNPNLDFYIDNNNKKMYYYKNNQQNSNNNHNNMNNFNNYNNNNYFQYSNNNDNNYNMNNANNNISNLNNKTFQNQNDNNFLNQYGFNNNNQNQINNQYQNGNQYQFNNQINNLNQNGNLYQYNNQINNLNQNGNQYQYNNQYNNLNQNGNQFQYNNQINNLNQNGNQAQQNNSNNYNYFNNNSNGQMNRNSLNNLNQVNNFNRNRNNYNFFNQGQGRMPNNQMIGNSLNFNLKNNNDMIYNNNNLLKFQGNYGYNNVNPNSNANLISNISKNNYFNSSDIRNLNPGTAAPDNTKITLDPFTRARGLENVGATCYMNATLECLYHVKALSENIINDARIKSNMKLTFCFKDLLEEMAGCKNRKKYNEIRQNYYDDNSKKDSVRPIKFKNLISDMNPLFKGVQANDSKDLIMFLLETMDRELTFRNNNISEMPIFVGNNLEDMLPQNFKKYHNSIFSQIFYGFQKSVMKCNRCKNENATYSVINFVIFPLEKIYNELNKQKNIQINNYMNMNNNYANNYANNYYQNNYYNYNMLGNMNNNMYSNNYNNFRMGVNNNIRALNAVTAIPMRRNNSLNINANENKKLTLYDCFKQHYVTENLTGANQIYCNVCRTQQDALMYDEIHIAPNVFIIILNRGRGNAFKCDLDFPLDLDLNQYIKNPSSPKSYELIGVISHLGESSMEGHFIAYCKHFDGNWYLFNDSIVTQKEINGVYNGTPYILFYKNKNWN